MNVVCDSNSDPDAQLTVRCSMDEWAMLVTAAEHMYAHAAGHSSGQRTLEWQELAAGLNDLEYR